MADLLCYFGDGRQNSGSPSGTVLDTVLGQGGAL
jgi:hypothetical protein